MNKKKRKMRRVHTIWGEKIKMNERISKSMRRWLVYSLVELCACLDTIALPGGM